MAPAFSLGGYYQSVDPHYLPCDIGGAKEPGIMYFPAKWRAKEPQNPENHRVVMQIEVL